MSFDSATIKMDSTLVRFDIAGQMLMPPQSFSSNTTSNPTNCGNSSVVRLQPWANSSTMVVTNEYSFDGGTQYPLTVSATLHGNHVGRLGGIVVPSVNRGNGGNGGQQNPTHIKTTLNPQAPITTGVILN